MHLPNESTIDTIRTRGFRPVVVGCFVNDGKVLMVFKRTHDLWQLPQGGVEPNETIIDALIRETKEELGSIFSTLSTSAPELLGEDEVGFPPEHRGTRELHDAAQKNIIMRGKHYFFLVNEAPSQTVTISETEFDDYRWLDHAQAIAIAESITQIGKRRITLRALELLTNAGHIR